MKIRTLTAPEIALNVERLSHILIESVEAGGAIGFLAPLAQHEAINFWMNEIYQEVLTERRLLFIAENKNGIVGTVQLLAKLQSNQPHRCEVAKMMVHPDERRKGIGGALMKKVLARAKSLNKNLIMLDTRTGDTAQRLYQSVGFREMGVVPDFALNPDRQQFHSTTYMYRRI